MGFDREGLVLFKNEQKHDKQPVMRGILTVMQPLPPGEYEVALWSKVSAKGDKYWSGNFQPKRERGEPKGKPAAQFVAEQDDPNDEIPF